MQLHVRLFLIPATIVVIALPLSDQPQTATTDSRSNRENGAFCIGVVVPTGTSGPQAVAARPRNVSVRGNAAGLFWESIFRNQPARAGSGPSPTTKFSHSSAPGIVGLPVDNAPPPLRSLLGLAQTVDVAVNTNFFSPSTVTITAGDTVRWTWNGSAHTVTSGTCCTADSRFCSPSDLNCDGSEASNTGAIYSHLFNTAGTFAYFCQVHGSVMTGRVIVNAAPTSPAIQFTGAAYSVSESAGAASVSVSRTGDTSGTATVNYATSDTAGLTNCNVFNGVASARCDYTNSVGTVRFGIGENSKTISIPIVDDSYADGSETFTITLSSASGATLGSPNSANVTINDNEASNGPNPIDGTPFFVRQQYLDFLNREPDPAGYAAWQSVINNCAPNDTSCDRIHVSSAFFRSPEFQDRGYFVYRFYPVAFGRKPDYDEFTPDIAKVSGFLSDAELEATKVAFITEFMSRQAFINTYNGLNDTQYVDTLLATAGVAPHQFRDFWIAALGNGTRTRATVLRDISESPEVYNKYFNQAFVVMQYFGYLRRQPDGQYLAWIAHLDSTSDYRSMINGFMNSLEYRFRFGP